METGSSTHLSHTVNKHSMPEMAVAVVTVPGLEVESASQEFLDWTGLEELAAGLRLTDLAKPIFPSIAARIATATDFSEIFPARDGSILEADVRFLKSSSGNRAMITIRSIPIGVGSPEILETLLENAGVGHAFIDQKGRYCRINNVLASINGFPAEYHIGRTIEEIIPSGASTIRPMLEEVFQTGESIIGIEFSGERPTQPGNIGYWQISYNPLRDPSTGEIRYIGAIVVDVTQRKLAEKMLRESEERFRSLAENSPDIIISHDRDFKYRYVSPQIEKYTGIPASEYVGKGYREMGFPEEQAAFFDRHLEDVFTTGENREVEYSMNNGGINIYSRLVPEFDDKGNVDSVM